MPKLRRLKLTLVRLLRHWSMRLGRGRLGSITDALGIAADDRALWLRLRSFLTALFRRSSFFLRALLLVRALQEDAVLQGLLQKVRTAAIRALLRNGLVVRSKV